MDRLLLELSDTQFSHVYNGPTKCTSKTVVSVKRNNICKASSLGYGTSALDKYMLVLISSLEIENHSILK